MAALQKIINLMGDDKGRRFYDETLRSLGMEELRTPNDSARFGNALIERGGVYASIGRSIKIQAILHGARVD